jgi:hypothetical protein
MMISPTRTRQAIAQPIRERTRFGIPRPDITADRRAQNRPWTMPYKLVDVFLTAISNAEW